MVIKQAASIAQFQQSLNLIYLNGNKKRETEYIYSYLARNSSYLSRSVLRDGDIEKFYIKTISWLFAYASSLDIDLEDAFLKKFPKVCPYCTALPCKCAQTHKKPHTGEAAYKVKDRMQGFYHSIKAYYYGKTLSIDEAVSIIDDIYPSNKIVWSVHGSFYHFTRMYEELGEIHEAFTTFKKDNSRKVNLEEELADFTAWLLSAWAIQMKGVSLKETLINYYSNGCPVCRKQVCECGDYSDRQESVVDTQLLETLKIEVEKLSKLSDVKHDEIVDTLKSIESALQSKSTTDAKRMLSQAKDTLSDASNISDSVANIGDNAKKVSSAFSTISSIIDKLTSNLY